MCRVTYGTSWQTGETAKPSPSTPMLPSRPRRRRSSTTSPWTACVPPRSRLYDTYGPGDRRNKVVNLIADAVNQRAPLDMSAGGQVIELVHVRDVLAATDVTLDLLRTNEPAGTWSMRCAPASR